MILSPEEDSQKWCCECGRLIAPHEGDKCPVCGGEAGTPPKVYGSEIEWLAAQKRRGGLQ